MTPTVHGAGWSVRSDRGQDVALGEIRAGLRDGAGRRCRLYLDDGRLSGGFALGARSHEPGHDVDVTRAHGRPLRRLRRQGSRQGK